MWIKPETCGEASLIHCSSWSKGEKCKLNSFPLLFFLTLSATLCPTFHQTCALPCPRLIAWMYSTYLSQISWEIGWGRSIVWRRLGGTVNWKDQSVMYGAWKGSIDFLWHISDCPELMSPDSRFSTSYKKKYQFPCSCILCWHYVTVEKSRVSAVQVCGTC